VSYLSVQLGRQAADGARAIGCIGPWPSLHALHSCSSSVVDGRAAGIDSWAVSSSCSILSAPRVPILRSRLRRRMHADEAVEQSAKEI
jgi:hypothetical protein